MEASGIEIAPGVWVPLAALRVQYSRASGPGGQNVNKLNTKAEIWLDLFSLRSHLSDRAMVRLETMAGRRVTNDFELHVASETQRSQEQNRQNAMQKIRELLVAAMKEPKPRRKTRPSKGSKLRRLEQKKRRGHIKARRQDRGSND